MYLLTTAARSTRRRSSPSRTRDHFGGQRLSRAARADEQRVQAFAQRQPPVEPPLVQNARPLPHVDADFAELGDRVVGQHELLPARARSHDAGEAAEAGARSPTTRPHDVRVRQAGIPHAGVRSGQCDGSLDLAAGVAVTCGKGIELLVRHTTVHSRAPGETARSKRRRLHGQRHKDQAFR